MTVHNPQNCVFIGTQVVSPAKGKVELNCGYHARPFQSQLKEQGYRIKDGIQPTYHDKMRKCVNELWMHDLVTEKEAEAIRGRIAKDLLENVVPVEKGDEE